MADIRERLAAEVARLDQRIDDIPTYGLRETPRRLRRDIDTVTAPLGGDIGHVDPDIPSDSPSTIDDEFLGAGTLDTKWTITNDPSGDNAVNISDFEGYLHVGLVELGTDNFANLVRIHQAPPDDESTWEVVIKAAITATGLAGNLAEFAGVSVYLGEAANSEMVNMTVQANDSTSNVALSLSGNTDNGSGILVPMSTDHVQRGTAPGQFMYLRLAKTSAGAYTASNTYKAYGSGNGITWWQVGQQTKTFTAVCDQIGIAFRRPKPQTGTPFAEALVQWFRRDPQLVVRR